MIPVQFDYLAPTTVEEALAALSEHGDDAKIIAGGQSLLPVLRMRLNAPEVVIDLGGITQLRGIREDGDALVIGAMTTHHDPLDHQHPRHQGRRGGRHDRLDAGRGQRGRRRCQAVRRQRHPDAVHPRTRMAGDPCR